MAAGDDGNEAKRLCVSARGVGIVTLAVSFFALISLRSLSVCYGLVVSPTTCMSRGVDDELTKGVHVPCVISRLWENHSVVPPPS